MMHYVRIGFVGAQHIAHAFLPGQGVLRPVVKQLAQEVREDITAMPYDQHVVVEKEGKTYLQTRYGDFPVYIPDRFFLINLNAARLACRQLGVKDADFYQALSEYSVSLQP